MNYSNQPRQGNPKTWRGGTCPRPAPGAAVSCISGAQAQGSLVTMLRPLLLRWKLNLQLIVPKCLRGLVMDPK